MSVSSKSTDLIKINEKKNKLPIKFKTNEVNQALELVDKDLILKNREKFISLMLIFGQINILKVIMKKLKIENRAIEDLEDFYFY